MNCKKTEELATGYAMNELDPDLSADVKQHVESCPGCRTRIEEVKATIKLLRSALAPDEPAVSHLDKQHVATLESALKKPAGDNRKTFFCLPPLRIAAVAALCTGLGFLLYFWKIHSVSRDVTAEIRAREVAFSYFSENQLETRRAAKTGVSHPETPDTSVRSVLKSVVSGPASDFSSSVKPPLPSANVPERLISERPAMTESQEQKPVEPAPMRNLMKPRRRNFTDGDAKLKISMSASHPDIVDQETSDMSDESSQVEGEIMSIATRQDSFNTRNLLGAALSSLIPANERQPLSVEFAKIQNLDRIIILAVASPGAATQGASLLLEIEFDPLKTKFVRELGAPWQTRSVFAINPDVYRDKLPVFVFELQPVNPDDSDTGTTIKLTSENKCFGTVAMPAKHVIAGIDSASAGLRLAYCIGCYADALKKPDTEKQAALMDVIRKMQQLSKEYPGKFIITEILDLVRASLKEQ